MVIQRTLFMKNYINNSYIQKTFVTSIYHITFDSFQSENKIKRYANKKILANRPILILLLIPQPKRWLSVSILFVLK